MTEAEWNACTDPQKMLEFLRASGSDSERKLRLFAVAVCRRIWQLFEDERSRRAVEMLEKYAEGTAGTEELAAAAQDAQNVAEDPESVANPYAAGAAANAVNAYLPAGNTERDDEDEEASADSTSNAKDAAFAAAWAVGHAFNPEDANETWLGTTKAEQAEQCLLLRDIIGRLPFSPLSSITPSLLERNAGLVRTLAQASYESSVLPAGHLDLARLAILADSLEDAGCTDADLLAHLRGEGPHVRGCWVIDLLLGKS